MFHVVRNCLPPSRLILTLFIALPVHRQIQVFYISYLKDTSFYFFLSCLLAYFILSQYFLAVYTQAYGLPTLTQSIIAKIGQFKPNRVLPQYQSQLAEHLISLKLSIMLFLCICIMQAICKHIMTYMYSKWICIYTNYGVIFSQKNATSQYHLLAMIQFNS